MTEPPADQPTGEPGRRRDVFAPVPRPRGRTSPGPPEYPSPYAPPSTPPAYPTLPAPGAYPGTDADSGQPGAMSFSPPSYPPPSYPPPYGYPQPPYPAYSYPPPAPEQQPLVSPKRWPWVLLAVAVAAAGVFAWLSISGSSTSAKVPLPTSFAGYTKVSGSTAQRVLNAARGMASSSGSMGEFFNRASIGVYIRTTGDTPGLVVIAFPRSVLPADSNGTADLMQGLIQSGISFSVYPAGAHGGALECGASSILSRQISICAWDDSHTVGLLEAIVPFLSPADAANATNALRDAMEH